MILAPRFTRSPTITQLLQMYAAFGVILGLPVVLFLAIVWWIA